MQKRHLDFYFDFISPFAYFSWLRITEFCDKHDLTLILHPVVFGKLLDHWGQLGPAEIPPKRDWLVKYCYRFGKQHGIDVPGPKYHPFNSLAALRLSLKGVSGEQQSKVVSAIFEAGWSQGRDIGSREELVDILESAGIEGDELAAYIDDSSTKDLLKLETADAIARGVFGVPTMMIDEELFWGNDQFDHMAFHLKGSYKLDKVAIDRALKRERATDRKALLKLRAEGGQGLDDT